MNFKKHLYFGQTIEGYSIPVINEREARAGAGILFFFAMISFFNSFLLHDFRLTKQHLKDTIYSNQYMR